MGGGGACQAPAGWGYGCPQGEGYGRPQWGGMGALKHFCRDRGSPKKPLIIRKKIHHIEKKVAERPSHGEKGPP